MIKLPWSDPQYVKSRKRIVVKTPVDVFVKLQLAIGEMLSEFYEYNNLIRPTRYYLKPVHVVTRRLTNGTVVKYYYYGRYWYRLEKDIFGKQRWIYVGREKPRLDFPDPPRNPLEGVVVKKYDEVVLIEFATVELYRELGNRLLDSMSRTSREH